MIDLTRENLIPLREVPQYLPRRNSGRRVHVSAVYRWAARGLKGTRLETVRIGGTTYTSEEALQRFADQLSLPRHSESAPPSRTTLSRQREIERAERRVKSILGESASTDKR